MEKLRQSKRFRTMCWQVFNAVIAYVISLVAGLEGEWQVVAVGIGVPVLNIITKRINVNIFGDLGAEKSEEKK